MNQHYAQMTAALAAIEDADLRSQFIEAMHQASLRVYARQPHAVGELAVLCWQHSTPIAPLSAYLKTLDPENNQLEEWVNTLNALDDTRIAIFNTAAPHANGITAEEGQQAYTIVIAMWHLNRAAMSLLMKDHQETEHMQRAMSALASVQNAMGFRFPPNQ